MHLGQRTNSGSSEADFRFEDRVDQHTLQAMPYGLEFEQCDQAIVNWSQRAFGPLCLGGSGVTTKHDNQDLRLAHNVHTLEPPPIHGIGAKGGEHTKPIGAPVSPLTEITKLSMHRVSERYLDRTDRLKYRRVHSGVPLVQIPCSIEVFARYSKERLVTSPRKR